MQILEVLGVLVLVRLLLVPVLGVPNTGVVFRGAGGKDLYTTGTLLVVHYWAVVLVIWITTREVRQVLSTTST